MFGYLDNFQHSVILNLCVKVECIVEEIWKDIPSFEGRYQVSNCGRVRSVRYNALNRLDYNYLASNNSVGQKVVSILTRGKVTVYEIRYLMACAFLGYDISNSVKPKFIHVDGNLHNIHLTNLRIADYSNLPGEVWRDIKGFEGIYQVSNKGRVKRLARVDSYVRSDTGKQCERPVGEKILKPTITSGYYEVNLRNLDANRYCRIHRLVAEAFIPNLENKPAINHIDGNKLNNNVDNLEWVTAKENVTHAAQTGLRKNPIKGVYRGPVKLQCTETGQMFDSIKCAAEALNLSYNYLNDCIRAHKSCHGYTFQKIERS